MTASPAADWIPTNGERPEGLADGAKIALRWNDGDVWELNGHGYCVDDCDECWEPDGPNGTCVTHVRILAPAQPAECDCGTGQVHSIHCKSNPPGERTEATPACNCGADKFVLQAASAHLQRCPMFKKGAEATINAGPEQGNKAEPAATGFLAPSSGSLPNTSGPAPVPAPQRQNLGLWLALRGRAPWPTPAKLPLAFPESAYWRRG